MRMDYSQGTVPIGHFPPKKKNKSKPPPETMYNMLALSKQLNSQWISSPITSLARPWSRYGAGIEDKAVDKCGANYLRWFMHIGVETPDNKAQPKCGVSTPNSLSVIWNKKCFRILVDFNKSVLVWYMINIIGFLEIDNRVIRSHG